MPCHRRRYIDDGRQRGVERVAIGLLRFVLAGFR
jgi:hypothetical protein